MRGGGKAGTGCGHPGVWGRPRSLPGEHLRSGGLAGCPPMLLHSLMTYLLVCHLPPWHRQLAVLSLFQHCTPPQPTYLVSPVVVVPAFTHCNTCSLPVTRLGQRLDASGFVNGLCKHFPGCRPVRQRISSLPSSTPPPPPSASQRHQNSVIITFVPLLHLCFLNFPQGALELCSGISIPEVGLRIQVEKEPHSYVSPKEFTSKMLETGNMGL